MNTNPIAQKYLDYSYVFFSCSFIRLRYAISDEHIDYFIERVSKIDIINAVYGNRKLFSAVLS